MELLFFGGLIYLLAQSFAGNNTQINKNKYKDYKDLKRFAESEGFFVTSTNGGKHNKGSKHYKGLAIDVRTKDKTKEQVDAFIIKARNEGIIVIDERNRPPGQKVWGGPHLHLEL